MSGFDKSRIIGSTELDLDQFTCDICSAIFNNPKVTECCGQTYCANCILERANQCWMCPNDCKRLMHGDIRPVPRLVTKLLDNMKVKCDYEFDGCSQVVRIGDLCQHLTVCEYRPKHLCKTCGLIIEFESTHSCIQSLITEKDKTEEKYLNLCETNSYLLRQKDEYFNTISSLRDELDSMCVFVVFSGVWLLVSLLAIIDYIIGYN